MTFLCQNIFYSNTFQSEKRKFKHTKEKGSAEKKGVLSSHSWQIPKPNGKKRKTIQVDLHVLCHVDCLCMKVCI